MKSGPPVSSYAALDKRELEELRKLAPKHPSSASKRLLWWIEGFEGHGLPEWVLTRTPKHYCEYCGHVGTVRMLAVNPISLSRGYYWLCSRRRCAKKLRDWEGRADARRRRAQYDWERENPEVAAAILISDIPPQYPSVSRATLRAFLDSGEDAATVDDDSHTVYGLNSSIKSLGFSDQVYAEIRSGQTVLRRVPDVESPR